MTGSPQTLTITRSNPEPTTTPSSTPTDAAASETASATPTATATGQRNNGSSFFDNKGAVAGVFTVVGLVILALLALLLFFLFRRRRDDGKEIQHGPVSGKGSPDSFVDTNQSFSMINGEKAAAGAGGGVLAAGGATAAGGGMMRSASGEMIDEKNYDGNNHIVPIEVDQRLDPGKVYMRWDHNYSRQSLQDEHDYSRKVLRVTNPDGR